MNIHLNYTHSHERRNNISASSRFSSFLYDLYVDCKTVGFSLRPVSLEHPCFLGICNICSSIKCIVIARTSFLELRIFHRTIAKKYAQIFNILIFVAKMGNSYGLQMVAFDAHGNGVSTIIKRTSTTT